MSRKQKVIYYLQQPHRIGQLVQEVWELRNMFADGDYEFVVITPPVDGRVNKACYDFVMRGLTVVQKRPGEFQWSTNSGIQIIDGDIYVLRGAFDFEFDFFTKFLRTKPPFYFSLTEQDIERSNRLRSLFNIPLDAVIVTVHNREPGYLPDADSIHYHAYRDTHIDNYIPAIEYLLGKGYYVIRLGDKTMKPLPPISDRLIDSPFHPMYSHFVELYFVSQSRFMLCAPSGPYSISWTFDVPTLLINRPMHTGCRPNDHDLMVPKKYYSHIVKRHLTYSEIITSPLPDFYQTKNFEEFGVELHESTAEEILRAVQEMDARLDGQYHPNDEIHRRIKQVQFRGECYRQHACPRFPHYSPYWSKAQLSHEFVKLNPYLLEDGLWLSEESPPQADAAQPQDTCASASLT